MVNTRWRVAPVWLQSGSSASSGRDRLERYYHTYVNRMIEAGSDPASSQIMRSVLCSVYDMWRKPTLAGWRTVCRLRSTCGTSCWDVFWQLSLWLVFRIFVPSIYKTGGWDEKEWRKSQSNLYRDRGRDRPPSTKLRPSFSARGGNTSYDSSCRNVSYVS